MAASRRSKRWQAQPLCDMLETWRDKNDSDAQGSGAARGRLPQQASADHDRRVRGTAAWRSFGRGHRRGRASADALYILTHVDVSPTDKDQAVELVKAQAEAARKDDGNQRYDVLQWDGHPNHFTLVEVWRDRKAFDTSVTTPQNKEFRDKLTPLEGALYDERLYHAIR